MNSNKRQRIIVILLLILITTFIVFISKNVINNNNAAKSTSADVIVPTVSDCSNAISNQFPPVTPDLFSINMTTGNCGEAPCTNSYGRAYFCSYKVNNVPKFLAVCKDSASGCGASSSSSQANNNYGCSSGSQCPSCAYPQSAYCFANKTAHNNGGTAGCGCTGVNQGDAGNYCTGYSDQAANLCPGSGNQLCTPGSQGCNGNNSAKCTSCGNAFTYGCTITSSGGSSSYANGQCGSCSGCYAPNADPSSSACALIDGICSKAGYCAPNAPAAHIEAGFIFCQDDGGPVYPLPGVVASVGWGNNQVLSTSDSNGNTYFPGLQSYPYTNYSGGLKINSDDKQNPFINQDASYNYNNLTVPGTGQPYKQLKGPILQNCYDSNHQYFYCSDGENGFRNINGYYCNATPTTGPDASATSYFFGVPSYGEGRKGLTFRFTNCAPPIPPPNPITIPVHVQCKATDGTIYPISNATIDLQQGSPSQIIKQNTDGNGNTNYTIPASSSLIAVRLEALQSGTLSNGQPYSQLGSSTAVNCIDGSQTKCSGGGVPGVGNFCGSNNSSYEYCSLKPGDVPAPQSYLFQFTNCNPPPPPITAECNQKCDANNICDGSQALSCQTNLTPNICRLNSNPNSTSCTPITTANCNQNCDSNNVCDTSKGLVCQTSINPNVCRLGSNPNSASCIPLITGVQCNQNCDVNNTCDSSKGLVCQTGLNPNVCRLGSNPSSSSCTAVATVGCNQKCDTNNICDGSQGLSCQTSLNPNVCRLTSNASSITCMPLSVNSVNINVNAFCQDGSGPKYPVQNLNINVTGTGYSPASQQTSIQGNTQFSATQGNGPFNISVGSLTGASLVGSSQNINSVNQPPSAMNCSTASTIGCTGNGNGNYCGNGNSSFAGCNLAGNNTSIPSYNFSFLYTNCIPTQCKDINKIGSDPVKAGPGNIISFKLRYQNPSSTNPYPNIKLRVSPTGASSPIIGRDNNNTTIALVSPSTTNPPTFDATSFIWTYFFTWEAADISPSTNLSVAGTYDVKVLTDGTNITTEASCASSLTISPTAQQQPIFSIVKQNVQVCDSNNNDTLTYTIIVKNIGPVVGVINFVEDVYDPILNTLNITPINLNPSGVVANGNIKWTGNLTDNTFAPNQSKTYTYQINILQSQLSNFSLGLKNHANVKFNNIVTPVTTSDSSIDLVTKMACNTITISNPKPKIILPNTGILDDSKLLLIGLVFIFLGYLTYKYKVGKTASEILLVNVEIKAEDLKEGIGSVAKDLKKSIMPFEESLLNNIDEKIQKHIKKSKRSKNN